MTYFRQRYEIFRYRVSDMRFFFDFFSVASNASGRKAMWGNNCRGRGVIRVMAKENVYKWSFIERVTLAVLNFGGNIVLARMLSADDFGLLAMIAIFTAMAFNLSSCGLSDGLIHKLHPTPRDYSTVFVFNSVLGLLFGLTAILLAHPIARFFGHEELVWVMRVYGVCFFFQTMSFVQETRLRKRLEMKKLCIARVSATATSLALGILLAALGYGYWALVSTQILMSFFMFVYVVGITRWFPRVGFSMASFREFFSFGVHLMVTYLIGVVQQNVNTFVLGRFYTSGQTGLYYQGAKLAGVPFNITDLTINPQFFVVASNETDEGRRRTKVLNMTGVVVAVNAAVALLLLLIARPAIELLYGERWVGAAPVMMVLSVFGCLACMKYFYQAVFKAYGRTRFLRNLTFVELIVQLGMLAVFYKKGLVVIALTQLATVALSLGVYCLVAGRMLSVSLREFYATIIRPLLFPLLAFAVGGAVKFAVGDAGAFWECLAIGGAYGAVMFAGHLRRKYLMRG